MWLGRSILQSAPIRNVNRTSELTSRNAESTCRKSSHSYVDTGADAIGEKLLVLAAAVAARVALALAAGLRLWRRLLASGPRGLAATLAVTLRAGEARLAVAVPLALR